MDGFFLLSGFALPASRYFSKAAGSKLYVTGRSFLMNSSPATFSLIFFLKRPSDRVDQPTWPPILVILPSPSRIWLSAVTIVLLPSAELFVTGIAGYVLNPRKLELVLG